MDAVAFLLGGPMLWACKASQYLRPPVEDDDSDDDGGGEPLWRAARRAPGDADAYLAALGLARAPPTAAFLDAVVAAHAAVTAARGGGGGPDAAAAVARVVAARRASASEACLALAWLLLALGFDARLGLARAFRGGGDDACGARASYRGVAAPQAACWAPAATVVAHVRLADGRDVLLAGGPGAPRVAVPLAAAPPPWRVDRRRDGLYVLGERGGAPRLLFDGRTNRPGAHFAAAFDPGGDAPAGPDARAAGLL